MHFYELWAENCPKMESYSLILKRTISEVTDSHTTGILI